MTVSHTRYELAFPSTIRYLHRVPIEKSHGRARPTLPRASDLPLTELEEKLSIPRGDHGHVLPGAKLAVGAGFSHTVKKALGTRNSTGIRRVITRDAKRLFSNILPTLASDAAPVRALLAVYARHAALNAYFTQLAEETGLDTQAGLQYLEISDRQSQRCERVLVTVHDLARVHSQAKAAAPFDPCPIEPPAQLVAPRQRKQDVIDMVEDPSEAIS